MVLETLEQLAKKEDITQREVELLVEEFPHIRPEYGKKKYILQSSQGILTVAGTIMGCGIAQIFGIVYIRGEKGLEEAKEVFKQIENDWKGTCGAIICTLGQYYRRVGQTYEENIKELGFEEIAEYPNFHHNKSGTETQKLYILKLKKG